MKEWIMQNLDSIVWIVIAVLSLFGSGTAVSIVRTVLLTKALAKQLDQARKDKYWSKCPHCGETVYFDELRWHMPDGLLDNNFNGIPDDKEQINL